MKTYAPKCLIWPFESCMSQYWNLGIASERAQGPHSWKVSTLKSLPYTLVPLAAWVDQLSLPISKHSLISEKIICKLRNVIKFLNFLHNFPLAYPSIWKTPLDFAQLCLLFPLESCKCLPGCLISSKAVFALPTTT